MSSQKFVLLKPTRPWRTRFTGSDVVVCDHVEDITQAVEMATNDTLWISSTVSTTNTLVKHLADRVQQRRFGTLLSVKPIRGELLPALGILFQNVAGEGTMLPNEQLAEVLSLAQEKRRDVFIGGTIDLPTRTLTLLRGDYRRVTVPLSMFPANPVCSPDFTKFRLDGYGHEICFGKYEATADVVLWETDRDYRARCRARERDEATGFGAALRRLRKQRGLSQDQLGVPRRTVVRIENDEVDKPRGTTLSKIAKALGVAPNEIETY